MEAGGVVPPDVFDDSELEVMLYEFKADPSGCTAPCAAPLAHVAFFGAARLTFSPSFVHGGLDATMDLLPAGAPPQRILNLTRFLPRRIVIQ